MTMTLQQISLIDELCMLFWMLFKHELYVCAQLYFSYFSTLTFLCSQINEHSIKQIKPFEYRVFVSERRHRQVSTGPGKVPAMYNMVPTLGPAKKSG